MVVICESPEEHHSELLALFQQMSHGNETIMFRDFQVEMRDPTSPVHRYLPIKSNGRKVWKQIDVNSGTTIECDEFIDFFLSPTRLLQYAKWAEAYEHRLKVERGMVDGTIIQSAARGDVARIIKLLNDGTDIESRTDSPGDPTDGETALIAAARRGQIEALRVLVGNGADIHARRKDKHTGMNVAALRGHKAVVTMLAEAYMKHARVKFGPEARRPSNVGDVSPANSVAGGSEYGDTEKPSLIDVF